MYATVDPPHWFKSVKVDDGHTCAFHARNPGEEHPNPCLRHGGCGCRGPEYRRERLSPKEIAEADAKVRREHEDKILAEADAIRLRRRHR